MKICVLKPIVWNSNNYEYPSGEKSSAKYIKENGYGHEEWNNNPKWIWNNYRIFHTEPTKKLIEYSEKGDLCIIMIASFNKQQYALGIASSVYSNDEDEQRILKKYLSQYNPELQAWAVQNVKKIFKTKENFITKWNKKKPWISWKAPVDQFYWFPEPIVLNPYKISVKKNLIREFSSYQRINQEIALGIVGDYIKECPRIAEWLTDGDFVTNSDTVPKGRFNDKLKKKFGIGKNAPPKTAYSYSIEEGKRHVEPMHDRLQMKYQEHLRKRMLNDVSDIKLNDNYVDIKYKENGREVFVEIKPTDKCKPKYAIRSAVGQLLEYQYKQNKKAILEIVISSKPTENDIAFVHHLNIRLLHYKSNIKDFIPN